jgi:hypothetical protein
MKRVFLITASVATDAIAVNDDTTITNGGKRIAWADGSLDAPAGGSWLFDDSGAIGHVLQNGALVAPPPPPEAALTQSELRKYVAAKRWGISIAGAQISDGRIPTDDQTAARLAQTIQSIDLGILSAPIQWKLPSGFASASRDDLVSWATAIAMHIQTCFAVESQVLAGIEAGTITKASQVDAAAWPAIS